MVKVVNHRSATVGLGRLITLQPGPNEVDPSSWDRVKGLPMAVALLAAGKVGGLTVDGPPVSKPAPSPQPPAVAPKAPTPSPAPKPNPTPTAPVTIPDLADMTIGDAVKIVNQCGDRKTLSTWARSEKRRKVVAAIDKRLAALENGNA